METEERGQGLESASLYAFDPRTECVSTGHRVVASSQPICDLFSICVLGSYALVSSRRLSVLQCGETDTSNVFWALDGPIKNATQLTKNM